MNAAPTSRLEYALLGLIRQGVKSGYELRKQFSTTPMGHFSDSPGSIYPALKRLAHRGWIRRLREDGGPRGRQSYGLTKAGESALQAWIALPVGREDVIWRLDELLLRFAFMGAGTDRAAAIAFLEAFESHVAQYCRELRGFLGAMPATDLPTGKLALENGLEQYLAQARWARRALASLRRST